jgi:hypothetical protein
MSSKLQRKVSDLLSVYLGRYTIRENYRPEWLSTDDGGRLELDFYVEELKFAIEVQGRQHYMFTQFFHQDYDEFESQLERDRTKREICEHMGVKLLEVSNESDARDAILSIGDIGHSCVHQRAITYVDVPKQGPGHWKKKRSRDKWGYGYNSETVQKHLRRIKRSISHYRYKTMTWHDCRIINASLQALDQYQESTEPIEFPEQDRKMFDTARKVVSDFSIAHFGCC